MIDQETLRKLREMKLDGMAAGFEELLGRAPSHEMTPIDVVGTLVDREWSGRENRRLTRLLKLAKIGHDACLEDVRCDPGRGLDKAMLRDPSASSHIPSSPPRPTRRSSTPCSTTVSPPPPRRPT